MNSDEYNDSSSTLPSTPKEQFPGLSRFSIVILCFFIGYISRTGLSACLVIDLNNNLNWTIRTSALWYAFLGLGATFAFVGGFIGDRTLKRKNWVWIGLLVEGVGILLLTTHSTPAVKAGIVLYSLGVLLFHGNILVVVAEYAVAAGVRLEIAFLIVFFTASVGGLFSTPLSIFLSENALLYPALTLVTITCGLLLLIATRYTSISTGLDSALNPSSARRRRVVLILAFLATRGLGFSGIYAFSWSEDSENTSEGFVAMFNQTGNTPLIVGIVSLLVVPLVVLWTVRRLRRGSLPTTGVRLISPGLAATGIALIIVGLGAGGLIPKNHNLLALTIILMFMTSAFLFIAMATLACTLVTNRWRGTVTALFAGIPANMDLTLLSWESWPLAAPLFITGAGILIAGLLWHLLITRRLATDLIIPKSV